MTVIAVIAILVTLLFPSLIGIRAKMERINCTGNLHTLFVGSESYLDDHGCWPQVNPSLLSQPNHAYDEAWIEALMPYKVDRKNWICPTIQRKLGGPDYTKLQNYRADYVAMPFDNRPMTPRLLTKAPWWVERGDMHGTGNLVILGNGSVVDLDSLDPIAGAMNH